MNKSGIGFGTWRFFLAFLVAISHLYVHMIDGPAAYAVWGFFVLSGYLMTLVLTTKYGTDIGGLKYFAFNRFLRIYPSYAVTVLIGLLTLWVIGQYNLDATKLNPQFGYPVSKANWMAVIGMVPFLPQAGLPVPVSGALFVEVWAYALMPLFARSKGAALLGLLVACAANYQYGFGMDTFVARYSGCATALLPFAVGALTCHYRAKLGHFRAPGLSIFVWCVHSLYWLLDPYWPWTYGLWLSVLLSAWVVLSLAEIKGGSADKWMGDLSYPVYLLHTTVAAWLLPHYGYGRPAPFFVVAFAGTIVLSWAMVKFLDRPMQSIKLAPANAAAGASASRAIDAVTARSVVNRPFAVGPE